MQAHRIHLRAPWSRVATDKGVRHQRRFNSPTGLGDHETVWVVIEEQQYPARVVCNDVELGEVGGNDEFDITHMLKQHNELRIDVAVDKDRQVEVMIGSVCLEIRIGDHHP